MLRTIAFGLLVPCLTAPALAQEAPLRRAGQALDRAGKTIRSRVESEVARGQAIAQERDVLYRVTRRIEWDKRFAGSPLQVEVQPGGAVILRGSVPNDGLKLRAVEIVANTTGVTGVVNQLAVAAEVKVIKARPAGTVIEMTPKSDTGAKVIVKP
jgi:osmotically-inducible protein OsmY